jgi:hypothetical protein
MLSYRSGKPIRRGDRVRFHGNAAEVEAVADPESGDPESEWYVKELGGGVLIADPCVSGHTFIDKDSLHNYEDLEFIATAEVND